MQNAQIWQRCAQLWSSALVLAGIVSAAIAADKQPAMLVRADNPDPQNWPTLGVWEDESFGAGRKLTMVSAAFPNVPEFVCDAWCYESAIDFLDARAVAQGKLELRHRVREQPHLLLITTVTPEPGAVEFTARVQLAQEGVGTLPNQLPFVNLCWQLRRAPGFWSKPDPYPEFVKRCFIFTEKGRTFLDQTTRRKTPVRPADDRFNNPPWVQMYVAAGQQVPEAGPRSWAGYSPDQYVAPVIGTVSRGGKYLAALANGSATMMAQAWHDCLHNNPPWLPADAPPTERVWRLKVYAMDNDPDALLRRVGQDFPAALRQARTAVP